MPTISSHNGSETKKTKQSPIVSRLDEQNPYDRMPYTSFPYRQTHPDRLATIATLFGLKPTPLENCRVIELGCAGGGNLIPMACQFPKSEFVGIDLSEVQVHQGHQTIESIGCKNVTILHKDILDIDESFGQFDYIIVHGIFSWVPELVQDKILSISSKNLTKNGVAYISYNTFPGWRMRSMIRDMMCYRTTKVSDSRERVRQSRAFLDMMANSVPTKDNAYGILLKDELNQMRGKEDCHLAHDYLEEVNDPIYFYQFMEQAERHHLQYLGEADFRSMTPANLSKQSRAVLQSVSHDLIEMEQYMDFLRNRMFRQTLLCHKDAMLDRKAMLNALPQLHISSSARSENANVDIHSQEEVKFRIGNATMGTRDSLIKAAMTHLGEIWPRSESFNSLFAQAKNRLSSEPVLIDTAHVTPESQKLADLLMRCYGSGIVDFTFSEPLFTNEFSSHPTTTPLIRYQAKISDKVTNLKHEIVRMNDLQRQVLLYLDGTNDQKMLVDKLVEHVKSGKLHIQNASQRVIDSAQAQEILQKVLPNCLKQLAQMALLMLETNQTDNRKSV